MGTKAIKMQMIFLGLRLWFIYAVLVLDYEIPINDQGCILFAFPLVF